MRYVALDLETTGLDRENCQVLQMALVLDEWPTTKPAHRPEALDYFEGLLWQDGYWTEPIAAAMNVEIFQALAEAQKKKDRTAELRGRHVHVFLDLDEMVTVARGFLSNCGFDPPWVIAGKNVAGFDLQFLPEDFTQHCHHRTVEVGSMALGHDPELWHLDAPPSADRLLEKPTTHDALEDARDVVRLIRKIVGEPHAH